MLDLDKTGKSIEVIEKKIDEFMAKNVGTIEVYNERLEELREVKESCQEYMSKVENDIVNVVRIQPQQSLLGLTQNTHKSKY